MYVKELIKMWYVIYDMGKINKWMCFIVSKYIYVFYFINLVR